MILRPLYRLLLLAFPRDVRRGHGEEMVELFSDMLEDRGGRGWPERSGFVLRAFSEAVLEGLAERGRRLYAAWRRVVGHGPLQEAGFAGSGELARTGGLPPDHYKGGVGTVLYDTWIDVKQAARSLMRTPGATGTLILTLALGIGATTAVFSVLHGVLLKPLPYDEPEELITLAHRATNVEGTGLLGVPGPDLLDYIERSRTIESMGSAFTLETNLNDDQGAARITLAFTTPDFFPTLGTSAVVGRMLDPSDWVPRDRAQMEDPNFQPPPMPVMLSHSLWQTRFGGDAGLVGRSVVINGSAMNVVGVMPEDFRLWLPPEAGVPSRIDAFSYIPIPLTEGARGAGQGGMAVARLAEGSTIDDAHAELRAIQADLAQAWPRHQQLGIEVETAPLLSGVAGPSRGLLLAIFAAIGLVLVTSVINVANLLLVRASTRHHEFAVRAALGVTRGRVVRKVLTESLLIGLLGTVVGLTLAVFGVDVLVRIAPVDIPRLDTVALDGTAVLFAIGVALVTSIVFGLAPALSSARADARQLVASRGVVGGGPSLGFRNALIVGEIALSVVLVAGAGLLLRSFGELRNVDPGYAPDRAVAVEMALPFFTYRELETRQNFFEAVRREAAELPGVEVAGLSPGLPLTSGAGNGAWLAGYTLDGTDPTIETTDRVLYRTASRGYMEALGARLEAGRTFTDADVVLAGQPDSEVSVVIDRAFADRVWPGEDPIDRTLRGAVAAYIGQGRTADLRVVGVIEPIRHASLMEPDQPSIYIPFAEYAPLEGTLVLRGSGDLQTLVTGVRGLIAELDPGVPVFEVRRLEDDVAAAAAQNRYALLLLAIFAGTALALSATGLYGVVSTSVQQRTREIGIRLALGAAADSIGRMVVGQGVRLLAVGLGLGLVAAVLAGRVLGALLFGVEPGDPITLVGTTMLLTAVAVASTWLPALRAVRLDPVEALRSE
jgi:predicted permease